MLQPRIFQVPGGSPASIFGIALSLISVVQCRLRIFDPRSAQQPQLFAAVVMPSVEAYEVRREYVQSLPSSPAGSQSQHGMRMVNVSRNSDLLFGEVTKSDSALLLQCRAPYSVQWVFRGDSDPEFNTNTTTTNEDGVNMYSAYLYLGSRRTLNERETGKYICTSVRNKKQYSYLYIFVTGSALFTNKGLETIYYSKNDESVRIPCSLSEPRGIATLQKSENGVLKCPMNDSVRFDPKQGFIVTPSRLDNPQGTYLCIANYNDNFQIIKYDLMEDDGTDSSVDNESSEFESTPKPPAQDNTRPPQTPAPSSTTSYPPVTESEDSKCADISCGENASCRLNKNGEAVCKCMENYTGNPYVECKPKQETTTTSTQSPSHPPPPPIDESEFSCESYDDCPYDRACYQNRCEDPCRVNSICGPHTHCHTQNHTPICQCDEGYDGDPYSSQEGQRCEQSHCNPNPCGPNSNCHYMNGIIACSCKPGFATQNDGVCRPHLTKEESLANNTPSSISMFPPSRKPLQKPLLNGTTSTTEKENTKGSHPVSGKECHYDIDCPDSEMCVHDKCEDPCVNACGMGATCHTRNHFPRCVCPESTTGDPFYKCTPLFSEIISSPGSTSTTDSPPLSSTVKTEPVETNEIQQLNCGGKKSPCGPNTVCQATRNHFVCACPNNFLGDPYSKRGCYAERGYSRCDKDEDCFHFMTCLRGRGCVNPCNVLNVCKPGRSCVPHMHKPACLKTNLDGETLRDGLVSEDDNNELGVSDIPETVKNSTCFVKSGEIIVSPCGQNSICYDANTNMRGISETMPVCGCMAGHIGDPYMTCEPLPPCANTSTCAANEACRSGYCIQRDSPSVSGKSSLSNPCYPSPCPNPEEKCVIIRGKNNAMCLSPDQSIKDGTIVTQRSPLSNRFHSRSGCRPGENCGIVGQEDDEADDDMNSTTEWATEFTLIPPTTMSSASAPSSVDFSSFSSSSSSIEETDAISSPRYFMHSFNFSSENTLAVIDA